MSGLSNRAQFLFAASAAIGAGFMSSQEGRAAEPAGAQPTPEAAMERLIAGNRRYMTDTGVNCNRNYSRRLETAKGQLPFAIILGCSDSRVPAEMVFDQGVGDLFMIRVAGNIAEPFGIGSIEYAVSHFHSPLLMVLGHEGCGAVHATLDTIKSGARPPGHVADITDAIEPAVQSIAKKAGALDDAVRANALYVAKQLRSQSQIVAAAIAAHSLRLVCAHYSLENGQVAIL